MAQSRLLARHHNPIHRRLSLEGGRREGRKGEENTGEVREERVQWSKKGEVEREREKCAESAECAH